jgi:zinc/manganese transport system substrate-binding protein
MENTMDATLTTTLKTPLNPVVNKNRLRPTITAAVIGAACLALTLPSHAALNVMTCEPEWAALASELGGDKIKVSSATTALQDPHRIEARPSLIAKTRNADLLICTGLELEVGWLPILLQQSGNAKIAPGQPGNFETGPLVPRLDVPGKVDRSEGDVHAAGNPHIQQDPHNIARVADVLVKRLAELDAPNAAYYQTRYKDFSARWNVAMQKWEQQAAHLKGAGIVEHHKNMEYLLHWLGLRAVGQLEPKPGVEPSASHLNELSDKLQHDPAKMVIRAAYQDGRASQWVSEHAHIPAVVLPFTVGGDDKAKDLFSLFDDTVQRLLDGAK